jgi:8-oxo-dGDP phosphatase
VPPAIGYIRYVRKPEVVSRDPIFDGQMITVHRDTLRNEDGDTVVREVVDHPDSVAVVALDEEDRVLLLRQYRHPVGDVLIELPAGLLDKPDEPMVDAARRELAEETGVAAGWWRTLVDLHPSPGMSGERVRVFLARDLGPATGDQHRDADEDLETFWMPLAVAVGQVYRGEITNGLAVAGLLATADALRNGYRDLRGPGA